MKEIYIEHVYLVQCTELDPGFILRPMVRIYDSETGIEACAVAETFEKAEYTAWERFRELGAVYGRTENPTTA